MKLNRRNLRRLILEVLAESTEYIADEDGIVAKTDEAIWDQGNMDEPFADFLRQKFNIQPPPNYQPPQPGQSRSFASSEEYELAKKYENPILWFRENDPETLTQFANLWGTAMDAGDRPSDEWYRQQHEDNEERQLFNEVPPPLREFIMKDDLEDNLATEIFNFICEADVDTISSAPGAHSRYGTDDILGSYIVLTDGLSEEDRVEFDKMYEKLLGRDRFDGFEEAIYELEKIIFYQAVDKLINYDYIIEAGEGYELGEAGYELIERHGWTYDYKWHVHPSARQTIPAGQPNAGQQGWKELKWSGPKITRKDLFGY
tara:strand:- start:172 stop:1119 length:948 start_codon:yes stop_codon:yes gene_type:complete